MEALEKAHSDNLKRAKDLEELNSIATQVAHDIRSPVMALEAVASTLNNAEPKKQKIILDSAMRINEIANFLVAEYRGRFTKTLNLTGSNKNYELNQSVKDILDLIKEEKLALYGSARTFNIFIHGTDTMTQKLNLEFSFQLKRILSNILNNSIEAFKNEYGKIDITTRTSDNHSQIQVVDNGPGIPNEISARIFERGISYGKQNGTGLGLAHAKEVLEKMGGKIELTSKEGRGTIVTITFPT